MKKQNKTNISLIATITIIIIYNLKKNKMNHIEVRGFIFLLKVYLIIYLDPNLLDPFRWPIEL